MAHWLLLAHQLPVERSNARVKIWRRLQQIGAVSTRNSVYVLPNTQASREDFEWLRTEIIALGGEATVFDADAADGAGHDAIVEAFKAARETDYRQFTRTAERTGASLRRRRPGSTSRYDAVSRSIRALRARITAIEGIDFCQAPGRVEAREALAKLEKTVMARTQTRERKTPAPVTPAEYRGRRWVTRPRPGVDRMSSAWLIRTFIDPDATFGFVDRPTESDIAFDMYEGQFTHQGSSCTFEVLAERFKLNTPEIRRVGEIVHDLDMKETRYARPEAATIGQLVEGLRRSHTDDQALLEHGIAMFAALTRSFER